MVGQSVQNSNIVIIILHVCICTEFAYYSFAIVTKFENNTKARKGQIMAKNIKGQNKY